MVRAMPGAPEIESQVTVHSRLPVGPEELWRRVSSVEGINFEMGPWLKFVGPSDLDALAGSGESGTVGLRLKGPAGFPLGRYRLGLVRLDPGRGFLEQTRMLPFLLWQHERMIEPEGDGSLITDRLGWRWKLSLLDPLLRFGVRAFFQHRHRRLRSFFA